ncbi:MAG: hypothetical protein AB9903_32180 [Vulcanimicrobiota bacterium]
MSPTFILMVVWSIIGLAVMFYSLNIMKEIATQVDTIKILLTVLANKQGATQKDIEEALSTKK